MKMVTGTVVGGKYLIFGSIEAENDNPDGLNLTTAYQYDGQGRVIRVTDPNGAWMIDSTNPQLMRRADPRDHLERIARMDAASAVEAGRVVAAAPPAAVLPGTPAAGAAGWPGAAGCEGAGTPCSCFVVAAGGWGRL